MSGNAWEWVRDVNGAFRFIRGASYAESGMFDVGARFRMMTPNNASADLGFRVARNAED